jgi:hypothetical protein
MEMNARGDDDTQGAVTDGADGNWNPGAMPDGFQQPGNGENQAQTPMARAATESGCKAGWFPETGNGERPDAGQFMPGGGIPSENARIERDAGMQAGESANQPVPAEKTKRRRCCGYMGGFGGRGGMSGGATTLQYTGRNADSYSAILTTLFWLRYGDENRLIEALKI